MTLADKIVVLRDGLVEQVGTPRELYERPDDLFVAQLNRQSEDEHSCHPLGCGSVAYPPQKRFPRWHAA